MTLTLTYVVKIMALSNPQQVLAVACPSLKSYNHKKFVKLFTIFLNYFWKYSFHKKMCQIKNEARDKSYKKGFIHILPNFNTLVIITKKLF